jgi:hypothetical protein
MAFDFMNFTNEFAAEAPQIVLREQPQVVVPVPSRPDNAVEGHRTRLTVRPLASVAPLKP